MTFGKFLAIAFMCHQKPERSFHWKGKQFPICARCTGVLIGYIIGIILAIITKCTYYQWFTLAIVPMAVDGTIQLLTAYESNNIKRLITGIIGGIDIVYCFITFLNIFIQ